MAIMSIADALKAAIAEEMRRDPTVYCLGEDEDIPGGMGGAFTVTKGLGDEFGANVRVPEKNGGYVTKGEDLENVRVINTPISEILISGVCVGSAMNGMRPVADLQYGDFLFCMMDQLVNQAAKMCYMSGGKVHVPMVMRAPCGATNRGAQHAQSLESYFIHCPGLKVICPSTAYDAKGLMNAALQGTDPVIFFESQRIYDVGEQFHEGGVPEGYYEIPLGEPDIKREGKDITILTIGATLYRALEAAKVLEEKYGMSAEVIDARSLVPFNYEKVLASVKKTGRIVIAGDAAARGSFLNDLARNVNELAFDYLDAPAVVLGSRDWITPAYELEYAFFPQVDSFIDIIHEKIVPLPGHVPTRNFTEAEQIRRAKEGI